ncbi:DUF3800 domain-containing protein [Paenibacillus sp. UNC451MF]|uniref:DUF3800 domain-containing protein n=1 Tax=Paenibacillus sp. UNC451MF TaxID=1449063 RepID=UPI00048E55B3|nr:DUF3800 domain-containing protein [Paenibacillus sp. UNC451MF]
MEWKQRPRLIEYWPDDVDFVMGVDENGTSDLLSIKRKVDADKTNEIDSSIKDFTLTGVIFDKKRYDILKKEMNDIKFTFWNEGLCDYKGSLKRVCFHSSEIRKRSYPFNRINYDDFMPAISNMIDKIPTKIISCYIDKKKHYLKYKTPDHPYHIAIRFIMERYCKGLNEANKKGIIIIESRGKKEDRFVLKHIVEILEQGTNQNKASHFNNIAGVYFNPKWWTSDNDKSTFVVLELADLLSFPIHKYARNQCDEKFKDISFQLIEKKFYKFPKYLGWGLKIWSP